MPLLFSFLNLDLRLSCRLFLASSVVFRPDFLFSLTIYLFSWGGYKTGTLQIGRTAQMVSCKMVQNN